MTKNVLFYARYSTDRQHEVSIETQIELVGKVGLQNYLQSQMGEIAS